MTVGSSPRPLNGQDWHAFGQQQQQQQPSIGSSSSSNNNHHHNNRSTSLASSPPPPDSTRSWGSQRLGGETVEHRSGGHLAGGPNNDPIGRPRSGAAGRQMSLEAGAGMRPIGSQRPSASAAAGVFAAASSAAARSRATSPANTGMGPVMNAEVGGPQIGMMGLGTSFNSHPFRLENSSSPSFVSALSHADHCPTSSLSQQQQGVAGTPKLVIEGFQSSSELGGGRGLEEDRLHDSTLPSFLSTHNDGSSNDDIQSPSSPTGSASAALASITARTDGQDVRTGGYPFPALSPSSELPRQGSIQRVLPLRSDTAGSTNSTGSGRLAISSPAPYLTLPNLSTSSNGLHSGLLSPTAATTGSAGNPVSNSAFSPFGSPPRATSGHLNQSTSAATPSRPVDGMSDGTALSDLELQLHSSPFLLDLLDRLIRVETSVKDVNRNISGLSRNVSLLLDRTKNLSASSSNVNNPASQRNAASLGQQNYHQQAQSAAASTHMASDDIRAINAQIAVLTSNVSQLLSQGGSGNSLMGMGNANSTPLAGLGLGGATPQLMGSSYVTTPQLGTFPGTPNYNAANPRMGHLAGMNDSPRMAGPGFPGQQQQQQQGGLGPMDRSSRLSPRPGASPTPSSRRWSSMAPGTPDLTAQGPNGAMNPPDPSVIVTKWEHLNLHQDLLRCILKYGLGPPNKIQQRALPFLLRGSDIIAQAPPTQERIASYVIPVLQLVLNVLRGEPMPPHMGVRGPIALIISTTVDQATQAQRMALGLGSALGVRVHIAAASSLDVSQEATGLIQSQPQIVVGTPQKMMDLFNYLANKTKGAISLDDIRLVVLDEVDQLIARNLADYVSTLLRILPQPRVVQLNKAPRSPSLSPGLPPTSNGAFSPFEAQPSAPPPLSGSSMSSTDRQTAIFSNTVPQDVLNFAQSIHLRESVRVLVRREGGTQGLPSVSGGPAGAASGSAGLGNTHSNLSSSALSLGASAGQAHGQYGPSGAPPVNTLGASPANNNANPLADPILSSLRGLRQYYLYVAVSTGGGNIGGLQSPNPTASQISHAVEMKLDVITDLLEDIDFGQAVIYTSSSATHEAVTYKLASKGIEALGLHKEMASTTRQQVLAKYRSNSSSSGFNYHAASNQVVGQQGSHSAQTAPTSDKPNHKRALVVYDVVVNPKDVHQVPLIVFYDLPRSVDEYKEKISCAASGGIGRPSVCVNVVTGSGGPRGDIEMLRSLECHLGCKMAELPMNPSQILNF